MEQQKKVILLAGPTASGKSKLAIKLAKYLNGEIINADSMQIYKEISILTSKPNPKDLKVIKHHLYGFNSVKKNFSTGHWLEMTLEKIRKQWDKKKTPIVVGGTGLYFKSLTEGLVKIPEIPDKIRKEVRKLQEQIGQKIFYDQLVKLDPLAKKFTSPFDRQRSIRAFEVKKFTNKSFYNFIKETKPFFEEDVFKKLFINTPRALLHKKIDKRVEWMFKNGAVKEVKNFLKIKADKDLSSNRIIGIQEIKDYLDVKTTLEKTKELIKLKTRQYAKRQFTWSRGHMKSWEMIYSSDLNDLFRKIINKIS
tara:strand:- start:2017 stop:2940 length:924 start_codon:yes stop_codon:yes gene_type:complete